MSAFPESPTTSFREASISRSLQRSNSRAKLRKKTTPTRLSGLDDDKPQSSFQQALQQQRNSLQSRTSTAQKKSSSSRRSQSTSRMGERQDQHHVRQSSPGDTGNPSQAQQQKRRSDRAMSVPRMPMSLVPDEDHHRPRSSPSEGEAPRSSFKHNNNNNNPLAKALEDSDWRVFLSELEQLQKLPAAQILPCINAGNDTGYETSLLQTAVWKAPPALVMLFLELLHKGVGGMEELMEPLCCATDTDGNTALHLACANLDFIENENAQDDDEARFLDTTVLQLLLLPSALTMQNAQGDTPLHLLMSSPMALNCSSNTTTTQDNKNQQQPRQYQEQNQLLMAAESAMDYVLDNESFQGNTALLQDYTGATPLHVAIAHGVHERLLRKLLHYAPKAAAVSDRKGLLPLHYVAALSTHIPATFVKELVEAHPEALLHGSKYGDTPLHVLISNATEQMVLDRNTFKVMELLMEDVNVDDGPPPGSPSSRGSSNAAQNDNNTSPITAVNVEHLNPLHCCALFDAPPQLARYIMKKPVAKRTAAVMPNTFGATPLHLAVAQPNVATSLGNVMALGTKEAAGTPDRLKRTPLHVAAQNTHATEQLIQHLTDLYPEATAMMTQRGHLPLHLAAQSQAAEPVISALIQAFPKAAEARNKSSNTPLHDAAKYRASVDVVRLLLDTYPDAVYVQNQYGNLPLHCATAYMSPPEVVQLLLQAWPDGAAMQNRNQDAPLHYAAAYTTSVAAVKPLIDAAPAAVLLLNSSGQSPIDRAKANNAPEAIVALLEESAEEWTKQASIDGWGSFNTDGGNASF